jgi:hypothetical protein
VGYLSLSLFAPAKGCGAISDYRGQHGRRKRSGIFVAAPDNKTIYDHAEKLLLATVVTLEVADRLEWKSKH